MKILSRTYNTSFDKEHCRIEKEIDLVRAGNGWYTVIITEKKMYTPNKLMHNLNDAIEAYKQAGGRNLPTTQN